jgi:hypothetical protein
LLDAGGEVKYMALLDVERILGEVVPVRSRTGTPDGLTAQTGGSGVRSEEFDKLSITTSFSDWRQPEKALVLQSTVRWGPERRTPEGVSK